MIRDRRHLVKFHQRTTSRDDVGQVIESWQQFAAAMCSIDYTKRDENGFQRDKPVASVTITFRPALNLKVDNRAELDSVFYDISAIRILSRVKMQVEMIEVPK